MPTQSFGFTGPAYKLENVGVTCDDVVNLYPKKIEVSTGPSGARYAYFNRPGLTQWAALSGVRGMAAGNNRLFAVAGSTLYELTSGSPVSLGTVGAGSNPAKIIIVPFGVSAAIVVYDGSDGSTDNVWVFDGVNPGIAVISAVDIGYQDGYVIALRPPSPPGDLNGTVPIATGDGTQINLSTPGDPFTWDPLQFSTRTGSSDQVLRVYTPGTSDGPGPEELWWMGKRTIEVWYNTGGSSLNPFPFERVSGAFVAQGVWAKNSVVAVRNSIMFLGGDDRGVGMVYRMAGYQPQRVSTHAIEQLIQSYAQAGSDTSDAIAYTALENGHDLYVLNFPTANKTLVYDLTDNLWHRRSFNGVDSAQLGFHHAWTLGRHFLAGGNGTTAVYVASEGTYDDVGTPITFQRTAPHINMFRKWRFFPVFELLIGGPLSDNRTFTLEVSKDNAFTFGAVKTITTGSAGSLPKRVLWRLLGRARDLVLRVTTTDALQQTWIDGIITFNEGDGN